MYTLGWKAGSPTDTTHYTQSSTVHSSQEVEAAQVPISGLIGKR